MFVLFLRKYTKCDELIVSNIVLLNGQWDVLMTSFSRYIY